MTKYHIIVTQTIDRIYEVEADSKEQAEEIYLQYDDRTKFVKERDVPELETDMEIKEADEDEKI